MKLRHIFSAFLLTGCVTHAPVVEPVDVKVPIAMPCEVEAISEPEWNIPRLAQNADYLTKLEAALADLNLSKGYIEELQAELAACS